MPVTGKSAPFTNALSRLRTRPPSTTRTAGESPSSARLCQPLTILEVPKRSGCVIKCNLALQQTKLFAREFSAKVGGRELSTDLRKDPLSVTAPPARRMAEKNCTQRRGLQLSWTSRRRRRERIIGFAEKSLLDLRCDLGQPFFRAVRSMPIMPKVSLEALYTFFGILKLVRELLRYVDCMVVVFCIYLRRLVKEGQNALALRTSKRSAASGLSVFPEGAKGITDFWFSRVKRLWLAT